VRPFSFRLESLRGLRQHAESQALEALAREIAAKDACQADLARADSALASARAATGEVQGPLSGADLAARQAYLERREQEQNAAKLVADAQDRRLADQRGAYEAAAVERAALDKLKDRRHAAHQRENRRADTLFLEEISLTRYGRAAGGKA
jgi:flagellar export protein FliJ